LYLDSRYHAIETKRQFCPANLQQAVAETATGEPKMTLPISGFLLNSGYKRIPVLLLAALLVISTAPVRAQQPGLRLYIFDNGRIEGLAPELFNFTADEVSETGFIVTSYLIQHPKGNLLWETGAVPDEALPLDGSPYREGQTVVTVSLESQLASIGLAIEDIDFIAMSHLHSDHNGNANRFAGARWIVQEAERDAMFSGEPFRVMDPALFSELKDAETTILHNEDHDVFGDGSVRILSAPGHTPGHQVLLVNLPETGPVLLAGDLYHFPEEIKTGKTPTFEFDPPTTAVSRARIQALLDQTGAQLWIGHDLHTHESLRFAPAWYE
jgi:N-acyl homoserine lactone hydrolase